MRKSSKDVIEIDYTGLKCGICGENFEKDNDVVVCPDCGTPMHRKCYLKESKCPNSEKHSDGFVFEEFDKIKKSANAGRVNIDKNHDESDSQFKECPVCGESNKKDAMFCNRCGVNLNSVKKSQINEASQPIQTLPINFDPLGGVPADSKFEDDITAGELACYVRVNTPYYMNAFEALKRKSKKFNLSAAVFSGVWFLYRKQYKIGTVILSVNFLLMALQYYFTFAFSNDIMKKIFTACNIDYSNTLNLTMSQYSAIGDYIVSNLSHFEQLCILLPSLVSLVQLAVLIIIGIVGNKLYYKHCVQKIRLIKEKARKTEIPKSDVALIINSAGGVNTIVGIVFFVFYMVSWFI